MGGAAEKLGVQFDCSHAPPGEDTAVIASRETGGELIGRTEAVILDVRSQCLAAANKH